MFSCWQYDPQYEVIEIILRISSVPLSYAKWIYKIKSMRVEHCGENYSIVSLPWFEPILKDHNWLIQKIKTYLLFS